MKFDHIKIILFTTLAVVFLLSCGEREYPSKQYSPEVMLDQKEETAGNVQEKDGGESNRSYSGFLDKKGDVSGRLENQDVPQNTKPDADEGKKHVYFGYMKLIVANLIEARNAIAKLAESSGGYVESSYDTKVVIRIPKDKFNEVFASLMGLGEVEKKAIETYDVTEYFQDLEMRLSVAEKTRARLYNLLERTQDVEQRLKILKEIKRLSEEIENTKLQLETIRRLIAYSSITCELVQRLAETSGDGKNAIPFSWIANLDPFYPSIVHLEKGIDLKLGDDFAVFDNKGYFFAESPEGIRIRAGTTPNKPEGDTQFWQKALMHYLGNYYKEAIQLHLGTAQQLDASIEAISFTSRDSKPFHYLVGIAVKGDLIFVIEVFFPDKETFESRHAAIEKSIGEIKFK
jgi:hypothetical protein